MKFTSNIGVVMANHVIKNSKVSYQFEHCYPERVPEQEYDRLDNLIHQSLNENFLLEKEYFKAEDVDGFEQYITANITGKIEEAVNINELYETVSVVVRLEYSHEIEDYIDDKDVRYYQDTCCAATYDKIQSLLSV